MSQFKSKEYVMKKEYILSLMMICVMIFSGCVTKVERVEVDRPIDLSGGWNDYDAQLVAEAMIDDALGKIWRGRFLDNAGRLPVVIVGGVENNTAEHINTNVFVKFIEKELLNSGEVVFVASPIERGQLRDERADQQKGFTDPATMAAIGKERGADFMMMGSINATHDVRKNKEVKFYQVNLEMINLSTNEKVWIGQKSLKKSVTKPRVSL